MFVSVSIRCFSFMSMSEICPFCTLNIVLHCLFIVPLWNRFITSVINQWTTNCLKTIKWPAKKYLSYTVKLHHCSDKRLQASGGGVDWIISMSCCCFLCESPPPYPTFCWHYAVDSCHTKAPKSLITPPVFTFISIIAATNNSTVIWEFVNVAMSFEGEQKWQGKFSLGWPLGHVGSQTGIWRCSWLPTSPDGSPPPSFLLALNSAGYKKHDSYS